MTRWDALWVNADLATLAPGSTRYGAIRRGALAVARGRIAWIGPEADLPGARSDAARVHDAGGGWITPGLVDCHTHLVFGGDRSAEFEKRLEGASYEEIARAGGGILSTVRATRESDEDALTGGAARRLDRMRRDGVTTVEIKSGYGLDVEHELRMLRVARALGQGGAVTVVTTLLGAHALPPEFAGRRAAYVDLVVREMIPRAVRDGLADAVDAFCERIAFTPEECAKVFEAARGASLPVRLHADQLSDLGGATLAARFGARSADHLEYASGEGVRAMAAAGTTAVVLPGAFYTLGETRRPPIQAFRDAGVAMAVATDANPGSAPLLSPLLALNQACTLFRLTPEEALVGMTRHGARVLGLDSEVGTLEVGKWADLAVWDVTHPRDLAYWMGATPLIQAVKRGRPVTPEPSTPSAA